ncbi:hypothetical protein AQ768_15875 [Burkholderia pseudomallei]|nr:hypothetical protein AQ768_15875 [Burkholderia pseudomallei]
MRRIGEWSAPGGPQRRAADAIESCRSCASRCELANGIRPPALQRLSRRRSPHTRQTPFQREPLRTCERHSSAALQRLSRRRSPHTRAVAQPAT